MNRKHFFLSFSKMVTVILAAGLIGLFVPATAAAGINEWTSNGPEGGPVTCFAVDPLTPATLYAGIYGGGVYKSADGGANWTAVNTGLEDNFVNALAINPNAPSTIYAGTYEGGVFKSTNGGGSWTAVSAGFGDDRVYALAIDPKTPSTLYAGTGGSGVGEVFKSKNGGGN